MMVENVTQWSPKWPKGGGCGKYPLLCEVQKLRVNMDLKEAEIASPVSIQRLLRMPR